MKHEHTPGPWRSTLGADGQRGVRNSGGFICLLPKPNHYTGQYVRYEQELEENKANAQLISAAPDLLEALVAALLAHDELEELSKKTWDKLELKCDHPDFEPEWVWSARAAIAKATQSE